MMLWDLGSDSYTVYLPADVQHACCGEVQKIIQKLLLPQICFSIISSKKRYVKEDSNLSHIVRKFVREFLMEASF